MSCQKTWRSLAAILVPVSLLAACGGGGNGVREVTHGGSVGDGPITGATVVVTDKNGVVLATETSDDTANYEIRLKVPKQSYPLQITATGGIDTVTQSEPDFTMVSVATDPSQSKANINPFSTLITKMALAMAGGLTDANIKVARNTVISTFGFGFDPTLIPDPVRTPVTETNIAAMVKASEALGEAVRRSRDALLIQGESVSGDSIMNAIAADMIDGSVDGAGASDSNPRTAAVMNVVAGQVLIEAMSNQLKVGDADATQAMDDAIRISMPDAPPTAVTKNVRIPKSMIEQTQRAVDAARAIAPGSALSTIASVISTLPSDALPSDIEQLLPGDTSADLDRAISGAVFATDTQLGDVNKVGRTFTDVNNDTDNGTGSDTGTGAGGDTNIGIGANNGPDAGSRTNADAGTGAGSTRGSGAEAGRGAVAETPTRTSRRTGSRTGGSTSSAGGTNNGSSGTDSGNTAEPSAPSDNQPRARSDSTSTDENQNVTIAVLNNDRGLEDTPLNVTVSERPAHGNVTVNDNNTVTYTPDADYSGEENFSYQVTDADGDLSIATVTINVICTSGCAEIPTTPTRDAAASPEDQGIPANITPPTGKIGSSYPSQKQVFEDPVSGKTIWRLTVDGTQGGALHNLRDTSGMEANSFSPQSDRICYQKTGHASKPDGYYVMDLVSGIETYVAVAGKNRWGVCEFSKISNELYYFYLNSGSSQSTTWAELRAVDLSTFSYRVLRRFPQVKYATGLTVNADGSLIAVGVGVGDPKADYNLNEYHFAIVRPDGSSFPGWAFDPADPPDFTGAGDHPYWSPFDPHVIRTKGLSNVLTSATLPSPTCFGCSQPNMKSFPTSHSCWSMDGEVVARSGGHPDCHPLDRNRGGQTRIARENGAYLYVTTMEKGAGSGTPPSGDRVAVTYHKVISGSHYTHPHPHFSRDGRYLLFLSTVADTSVATPPGGTNNQGRLAADLFVVLDP